MTDAGDGDGTEPTAGPPPTIYRTLPSRILGWTLLALAVGGGVTALFATGSSGGGVVGPLGVMAALSAVAWMVLLRPCVELHTDRVVLRNLITDLEVPFSRVAEVGHTWALELTDTAGARHSSWAIPVRRNLRPPGRVDRYAEATTKGRAHRGIHAEVVAGEVEGALQTWRREGGRALQGDKLSGEIAVAAWVPLAAALALVALSFLV